MHSVRCFGLVSKLFGWGTPARGYNR